MIPKLPKKSTGPRPLKAQSSNVVAFIHDPDKNTLDVTFHGGRVYRYDGITSTKLEQLKQAPSKGEFLNKEIIPHHTFKRIK